MKVLDDKLSPLEEKAENGFLRQGDETSSPSIPLMAQEEKKEKFSDIQSCSQAFEVILDRIGRDGRWQWQLFFITSFCGMFTAFHNLAAVFLAATPEHWCHIKELDQLNSTIDYRNISIPWKEDPDGGVYGSYSTCEYYDREWDVLVSSGVLDSLPLPDLPTNVTTKACKKWNFDHSLYQSTVVEEWILLCRHKYFMSLVQSTFMAGVLTGAVVSGVLADKFGRRTIALWSAVGFLISSVGVGFTHHYIGFIILRFLVAAFGSGLFLPCFVLLMEVVGPEARTVMGMMYQAFFSVGFMLLPLVAYFIRDWRVLQISISIPNILLLAYYWILPESPRWLMMQGRYEEAIKVLRKVAEVNKKSLPTKEEMDILITKMKQDTNEKKGEANFLKRVINVFKSVVTLLSTANMRRRCLIIFFAWFVVSMIYYGLTFSGGNINASIYLMVFFSGVVEIPSYLLVCFTLKKFGRRLNLCVLFLICGAACLLILAVPKELVWMNIVLATIGKFFNSSAFAVAYIYSAELVPTGVRNIAVGTSSMCARIGSGIAPFIVDLMGDLHYTLPSTVFGLLSVGAGLLALLLPETSKIRMPETVAEIEAMPR
ncbi:hypothetical protein SK128_014631 [Halocaridina rubra]|uniref:Major facilitator superfamily (MFS) profile domain-containing protein n=1 Tax=Halocaridina rubra TaxID=373956 RepID=A0AAN9AG04_HALRR